ncbi:MAG: flagellar hook-associated protein FlgK [Rhizomicrobium sp.]|nr:flagellar hook-associated protein FlgK [Rhizomicrobium sp.]
MGLNGILSGALTSLQANTSALKVTSQNIANLNTANYARRVVDFGNLGAAGSPVGVTVEDVRRVTDQYLTQEALTATSTSNQCDAQSTAFDQINTFLGSPGDGSALTTKLNNIFTALGAAQLSPTSSVNQGSVVSSMKSLASSISSLSSSLDTLGNQTDAQLGQSVQQASSLIKQVYDYNQLIKTAGAHGNTDTTYLDQRDTALNSLAQQMDIKVAPQDDGSVLVTTQDGLNLVGDSYAKLSYTPGSNGVYGTISAQDTNGTSGNPIGAAQTLDSHLTSGTMRGLIDMRDTTIGGLKAEVGTFAKTVAQSFNQVHNANSSYPAPTTMTGSDTGLLASDSLNFSGQTTISLTDSSGTLQHTAAIDFSAGTITVDGSASYSFTNSIGAFTTQLNSALTSVGGSASFTDGQMSLSGGSSGLVMTNPTANSGQRAGTGFSQFFGLNDLFTTSVPNITTTGMVASDNLGLAANGQVNFVLKNAAGAVAAKVSVPITAGMTVGQAVTAINTALGSSGSVSLGSDGAITTTLATKYTNGGYQLLVASDTTSRGTTGVSLTELFGIGANTVGQQADNFSVKTAIANNPSLVALGKAATTGTQVIGSGNSAGLQALQALASSKQSFSKAGSLAAQTSSLSDYAGAVYQDVATKSSDAASNKTTQGDRLTEAQSRMSGNSGVNLDEELSNMIIYQRSYSASARLLTTVGELYDTLLSIK